MLFGENAKVVLNLINEFIDSIEKIPPEKDGNLAGQGGFAHAILLHEVARLFIIETNFKKEKIFDKISDLYNKRRGVADFTYYRKGLEKEKEFGFLNLALIVKNKLEEGSDLN